MTSDSMPPIKRKARPMPMYRTPICLWSTVRSQLVAVISAARRTNGVTAAVIALRSHARNVCGDAVPAVRILPTVRSATDALTVRDRFWDRPVVVPRERWHFVEGTDGPPTLALDGGFEPGRIYEIVYPAEGVPVIVGPNGIFKDAPNPNAARLFQCYCFTPECQQLIIEVGGLRSMHPQAKEKPGRRPFREVKTMKEDPVAVEKMSEEIKARYSKLFGV